MKVARCLGDYEGQAFPECLVKTGDHCMDVQIKSFTVHIQKECLLSGNE